MSATRRTVLAAAALLLAAAGWHGPAQAQFELPRSKANAAGAAVPPARLDFQYAYGIESPLTYRRDKDLDPGLRDNTLMLKSKIFASIVYRPTDWLTTTLEMKLGREYAIRDEDTVVLPSGDVEAPRARNPTLLVEQAIVTVRGPIAPFEINLGRRNYEDDRHWLFDGSIDVASLSYRHDFFRAEAMVGRDVQWSMDLLHHENRRPTSIVLLSGDYRGFDNQLVGLYAIRRSDPSGQEGRPLWLGLRATGKPAVNWSYWAELALLRGHDGAGQPLRARGIDVGATYRFANLPFDPNVTLGYAFGSGDGNPGDGVNTEFRQTGLHSNEARFIGLAKFKTYGETLDPELSNLKILTLGLGLRATPGTSIDLAYHRYRFEQPAFELRDTALTAQLNTLPGSASRAVGQALDLVVGFRGLFGLRRLGLDLRIGQFRPDAAFRRSDGNPAHPDGRAADKAISAVAKFRW